MFWTNIEHEPSECSDISVSVSFEIFEPIVPVTTLLVKYRVATSPANVTMGNEAHWDQRGKITAVQGPRSLA